MTAWYGKLFSLFSEQAFSWFLFALRVRGKEIRNMTSPEQNVQDRCESFKSIHVRKFHNLEEEIEKLPD